MYIYMYVCVCMCNHPEVDIYYGNKSEKVQLTKK
jgi:hypothetical protein